MEYKEGDNITATIEGTVGGITQGFVRIDRRKCDQNLSFYIHQELLVDVKLLPKLFALGDIVRYTPNGVLYTALAVHEGYVWIKEGSIDAISRIVSATALELVEAKS